MTSEPTLDDMREILAAELPQHAAFDGWTAIALERAAFAKGIDLAIASLAFPAGAPDMIDAWFAHVDDAMLAALPAGTLAPMKIRDRITALVQARLDIVAKDIEALRRALAVLAMPQNLTRAARLNWRAADAMWVAAGDTATDFNHYSKRAILGGVYVATVMAMLSDESEDRADTRAFLARRIDGIMRFEKAKARFTHSAPDRLSLGRFLGRLRYPAV
ncbi:MAG: COQ9 family protein [Pseudomonadota bacterium]